MNQNDHIRCVGEVEQIIEWKDGRIEINRIKNTVLQTGRMALAVSLANDYGEIYQYYISHMLFGNGGTSEDGTPLYVSASVNGLFGSTFLSKPVSAVIDPDFPYQVVFTSVITYEEANGEIINEMGLQMNTGDLYSMTTFGDITKNSNMQITWSWRISYI